MKPRQYKYTTNNKGVLYDKQNIVTHPRKYNPVNNNLFRFQRDPNDTPTSTIPTHIPEPILFTHINNVYQHAYNNADTTGLGDFIRGSYCIMQYCDIYNKSCSIKLNNHTVSELLYNSPSHANYVSNMSINKMEAQNYNPWISSDNELNNHSFPYFIKLLHEFLNQQYVSLPSSFPYVPSINVCVTAYPLKEEISLKHKLQMRNILTPNKLIHNEISALGTRLNLPYKTYTTIHIRSGDNEDLSKNSENTSNTSTNSSNNGIIPSNETTISLIIRYLQNRDINSNNKYLLLVDSEYVKKEILKIYPYFKTTQGEIVHTKTSQSKLKDTMIEFYLMALSKNIMAFSVYTHGSGFSKWCAETYNIPYSIHLIREQPFTNL